MTNDEIKSIAERFIQSWSAGGQAVVDELAAPDITISYNSWPAPVQGAQVFKSILTQTFDSFPDMRITTHDVIVEGNQAVVCWSYKATHQRGIVLGVEPTGAQVHVAGVTRYEIEAGKVIHEQGIVDVYSLMTQLGAISS